MRKVKGAAVAMLMLLPVAARAETLVPPEGCDALLTVQSQSCIVRHVMRCADNAGGFTIMQFGAGGAETVTDLDAGSYPVEAVTLETGAVYRSALVEDAFDARIAATQGRDSFAYETVDNAGTRMRYVGKVVRDGRGETIDGVPLVRLLVEREVTSPGRAETWRQRQVLMYHPGLQVALTARVEMVDPPGAILERMPVAFAAPGEPGFLSMEPEHGCGD